MNLYQFWTEILQTNTFNFIILVILLAIIFKVCKINTKIDSCINNIKESIDKSVSSKESSMEELNKAKETVANVQDEIKEIKETNDAVIKKSEEKIAKETTDQIENINKSIDKILDNKEYEIISKLSKDTVTSSIELAKEHIKNLLKKNPEYHKQFIDKSINELTRLKNEQ